jgi:hypothetical protein
MNEAIHERILTLEEWKNGKNGALGASAKLEILWRSHVWLYCTLSAAAGSGLTIAIQRLLK